MLKAFLSWRGSCHLYVLITAICLFHLVAFQGPLLSYARSVESTLLQLVSLQILQIGLMATLLLGLSAISVRLMKLVATVLIVFNASALYFMRAYQVELDLTMIGNVFRTNTGQTLDLWHYLLGLQVLVLGIIPAWLIWPAKVRSPRRIWRSLTGVGVLVGLIGWLFATASTWLWYDEHATRMGAKILPWSYVVNTGRYYNEAAKANRPLSLLSDAAFLGTSDGKKDVVVLVMGEAARAQNFPVYGYDRDTMPFTADTGMFALPYGQSCATYTIGALACVFTHEGREASPRTTFEALPSYLRRHGVHTIMRTNGGGMPRFSVDRLKRGVEIAADCQGAKCPQGKLDGALFHELNLLIENTQSDRIFIVLHQTGSHGPRYFQKYPADFAHFTPVCDTVQVSTCSRESLYNAYDNSLRYTDFLLADLIGQLEGMPDVNAAMIYVSDHGQSLGEGGFYLHGTPPAIAPDVQRDVPFFVWMSDGFRESRGIEPADVMREETFPHDFPFHSVMGAFGMRSEIYKPEYDIFSAATFN